MFSAPNMHLFATGSNSQPLRLSSRLLALNPILFYLETEDRALALSSDRAYERYAFRKRVANSLAAKSPTDT